MFFFLGPLVYNSQVEPHHKCEVGYKCDFVAEYDSLGDTDSESGGCHFGTLEHFFLLTH